MKRLMFFMFGVLMLLPTFARDFTYTYENQTLTYTVLDEEAKTCQTKDNDRPNNVSGDLIIPAIAKDGEKEYSVINIGQRSFLGCSALTSVVIPNSVTFINSNAFSSCKNLISVVIPHSVTSIYSNAFSFCYALTSVIIPDSVTSIHESAFCDCIGLTSVVIGNSVRFIGDDAFNGCSSLTSVFLPQSITYLGWGCFTNCNNLVKIAYADDSNFPFPAYRSYICIGYPRDNIILENGTVFSKDKKVIYFVSTDVKDDYIIPDSVTTIGESAFRGCTGLTSVVIPDSVTTIGESAFRGCTGLTSLVIPDSVTKIGDSCFSGCTGLTSLVIPDSVTTIGDSCFSGCTGLTSLEIGNSVTLIGSEISQGCSGLISITINAMTPPRMSDNSFEGLYESVFLSVPTNTVSEYLVTNWGKFENISVGDSQEILKSYETGNLKYRLIPALKEEDKNLAVIMPSNYSALSQVTIPERFTVDNGGSSERYYVDAIGYGAFENSKIDVVEFNSRNATRLIGDYAFAGNDIFLITLPETVAAIGDYAFSNCKYLYAITIPEAVETIGKYAFNKCANLREISLPSKIRTIEPYTFYGTSLGNIALNEGLESIGEYAFYQSSPKSALPLTIPSTLSSIGVDAFANFKCEYVDIKNLESWCNIDFGNVNSNPVTKSGGLYLKGEIISDLVIPNSIKEIKDYAFNGCGNISTVKLPNSLQKIGVKAFSRCYLSSVTIPGNVICVRDSAFVPTIAYDLSFTAGSKEIEIAEYAFEDPEVLYWDRPLASLNLYLDYDLKQLTIGNSVTEIPAKKFKGARYLNKVTLGNNLKLIGDEAFSSCGRLTEIIIPPSVESIGERAFSGDGGLSSIIMGCNVKTIGEKAFYGCSAQNVRITAQTPPYAPDNTFSNYTGSLYVQGREALDAYYDADYCWFQFESLEQLIEPTDLRIDGDKTLVGKPGDTFQLTATLYPDSVSLPQIFWRSTNPEIASVDCNGLVTLHADMADIMAVSEDDGSTASLCKIIAESLYADGPIAEVMVNNRQVNVDSILDNYEAEEIDFSAPVEIFNLQGVKVATAQDGLSKGIYIVRQGKNIKKIAVK